MKILQLISSTGFFGAENAMVGLSRELCFSEYKPYIGIIGNSQNSHIEVAKKAKESKLEIRIFYCNGKFDMRTILGIRQYMKENKIGIIHSHNYKSNFYGLLASLNMDIKRITTCHNWLGNNLKMRFYEGVDKLLLNRFDKIITVSKELKKEILKYSIPESKIVVINNGINMKNGKWNIKNFKNDKRREFGIKENEKVIGTVGRLTPEKGHIYLLRAFGKVITVFPNVRLMIIGDGSSKESLKLKVKSLKLEDKIIFTGIRDDIPELLNLMDVFVMPSLKEGMPMALLEAMASKKPAIGTKVGAISKVIENDYTGLLIEPGNEKELSESIIKLLKDREKANFLAQNGYEEVKNEFSTTKMAERYMAIYSSL